MMLRLKRLLIWCTRHRSATQSRRRQQSRRNQENSGDSRQSQQRQRVGGRLFGRRAAVSMDEPRRRNSSSSNSSSDNMSTETLVDEKHRARAFSDPAISEYQHIYSYYPWSESEHEEILSRSPPPLRPHYATFPSLVEMGGFLSI
ncbi:hypothetical protein J3B02_001023 [Coemansia erecta]|uniref:Uncharacterized protein n=1 Tax=Coemansia asiatica TaxID=1052880 RepID=A0A9W7XNC3_9FUNG|nr:hypothetical protein LPJ64_001519 [Coemansia asiatica]KAJ2857394.1 hypothetical protein J3B02_001023 [Coemansia erecta]KAJ2884716.1 hypothetical protein FB639_001910 [Coemansia asiatica]